ncbi:MAG: FtsH protease activity modulator HflK [Bryobacterales bacterium]|nr:FtsH protease activity modulator HflK [Bryobacterales bacterium]
MHQHRLEISTTVDRRAERWERIRYFGFAGTVGFLLLLNLTGVFRTVFGIDTAAILTLVAGYRTFNNAIRGLLDRTISADLAISIAVVAALSIGEYLAAAEAMFIMLVGEGLEGYAAKRTSTAIQRFVEQMPRRARKLLGDEEVEVDAAALAIGDVIAVRAGERIAADGVVLTGASAVDESTITGESMPRDKQTGDEVFSGTLNGHGLLRIRVTRAGDETTLARVIKLVEQARERRAPVERLADRYAKYFVPALLLAGAGTYYFTRDWMRTVAVLIVGCPCALILATPTAMVAAIGGLARRGILVRGGTVLQQAAKVDAIVFDKTGTVTEGRFEVLAVVSLNGGTEAEVLALAAAAESGSDHMLARVIVEEARNRGVPVPKVESAHIVPGRGAQATRDGKVIRAGNEAFLAGAGVKAGAAALIEEADRLGATVVLVAEDDHLWGGILLRDRIRAGVKAAAHELQHLDISYQVLLTGDRKKAAQAIARELEIPEVEAELLPEQKLERVQRLMAQGRSVAMVGDGVNDAPALAAATVGIAVSGASDITAEAADVVYMGRSLEKLPKLFEVSRRAVSTAWQNIFVFAFLVNVATVGLASTGKLGPLGAAFTHQIASFLVMLNSLRLLRVEREPSLARGRFAKALDQLCWTVKLWRSRIDPHEWWRILTDHPARFLRPALLAALAVFVMSGFYVLEPDEVGVVERFGRKLIPYKEPGLHYKLPWPVESLTRIAARRVRVAEVGFRTERGAAGDTEPAAYEWNVQHRSGRFVRKPEESLMLTGDQNMLELTATVHYRIARPDDFLFRHADGEATVRAATEAALQSVVTTSALDDALTANRRALELRTKTELQRRLDTYRAGVEVLQMKLLDVHPSVEVVDAFRDVSGAFEEKNRLINDAEGYRNEQVALARGNAAARLRSAGAYSTTRVNRAEGDAARFVQTEAAYRVSPGTMDTRLYLETMEQVLPGKRKMIVDSTRAPRRLVLMEDALGLGPAAPPIWNLPPAPPPAAPPKQEPAP